MADFTPALRLALLGGVIALAPLSWLWVRHRGAHPRARLRALTWGVLFLTFDLILFGAFTRLTDSGLGCPDWPGCYGNASPIGAHAAIEAAQTHLPSGPVTHGKAWVEMIHRYLAAAVGALILVLAAASWAARRRGHAALSPAWAFATLIWVCVQGAFGAWTVTLKLYPAIVTAHLLGGLTLLALLIVQAQAYEPRGVLLPRALHRAVVAMLVLAAAQIALGAWVSSNYAVLACSDFPTCQGRWWPAMDFEHGFAVRRELGVGKDGGYLPFEALTAIHMVHRLGALVVAAAAVGLMAWMRKTGLRGWAQALTAVVGWQVLSGLSNVVLGWPLLAALAHTGGAAVLIGVLVALLARASRTPT